MATRSRSPLVRDFLDDFDEASSPVATTPGDPAFVPSEDPIQIAERSPSGPDAVRLLHALHAEQVDRYGFADPAELSPSECSPPHGVFAIACKGAAPIGCLETGAATQLFCT